MVNFFHRVIVGVGNLPEDGELLRYARVLHDISPDSELYVVHVLGWPSRVQHKEEPTTHAEALRKLELSVAEHCGPDVRARCLVRHGNPVDHLLESAAGLSADLILVGHSKEHSRRSIARRLAMQAPCSLWMRPRNSKSTVSNILAAVDYSEPSAYALSLAGRIARMAGKTECLALHVYLNEGSVATEEYEAIDESREREAFDRFIAPLDTSGVKVEPILEESASVAHSVARISASHDIDLVVMGSRGKSQSVSTLLGSESEHVLMESQVPVLIAKRRGERIGLLRAMFDRDFHLHDAPRFG